MQLASEMCLIQGSEPEGQSKQANKSRGRQEKIYQADVKNGKVTRLSAKFRGQVQVPDTKYKIQRGTVNCDRNVPLTH